MRIPKASATPAHVGTLAISANTPRTASAAKPWAPPLARFDSSSAPLSLFESSLQAAGTLRRSHGPEGTKPLLARATRRSLSKLVETCAPAARVWIDERLASLSSNVARAILLRAIAARASQISSGPVAWAELDGFTTRLQSMSDAEILARATVLDLDSKTNSSDFGVAVLSSKKGTIHAPPKDLASDNDGLFQKFTASCGPTVLQMMICELDPLQAFALHDQGLHSDSTTSAGAAFQQKLLEKFGGVAIGRRLAFTRARLNNALGQLQKAGELAPAAKKSYLAMTRGEAAPTKAHREISSLLRARYDGFPSKEELAFLRSSSQVPTKDEGIDTEALRQAIQEHVSPLVGVSYVPTKIFARGQAWRHLDAVEKVLRGGVDVPFGISEPGHWMLLTHVRGKKPNRRFLVSDPEAGRTAWVGEQSFVKGTFGESPFQLCTGKERSYVDVFFLPA